MSKINVTELNKAIDQLNGDASKLQDRYQAVGFQCLQHLDASGDVGPVNRLLVGMPKGQRRLAMATWMVKYAKLQPNPAKDMVKTMPLAFAKGKENDLEGAAAEKWWDTLQERSIDTVFDLQVAIKSLLNRCKGKTLMIGGESRPHEAEAILRSMAAGVGLPVDDLKVTDGKAENVTPPADAQGVAGTGVQKPATPADVVGAAATSDPAVTHSESQKRVRQGPAVQKEDAAIAKKGTAASKGASKRKTEKATA